MKKEFKWKDIPRVLLRDKASYSVDNEQRQLNTTFASGLQAGRFRSWTADGSSWLAGHLGDFYPHETLISHVRRLLSTNFARSSLYETPAQFASRMKRVEHHLNYVMKDPNKGDTKGGQSLERLNQSLRSRAQQLKDLKGERIPK